MAPAAVLSNLAHWNTYDPGAFGWERETVPRLVPFQYNGVNFGQVAADAHDLFTAFLGELVPKIPGGLEPGKCWGYASTDDLEDGSWSFHHYGLALDINWDVNPMGHNLIDPAGPHAIPRAAASALALKYGLEWGGNWRAGFHDLMHFEVHLSPGIARDFRRYLPPRHPRIWRRSPFPFTGRDVFGPLTGPEWQHGGATPLEREYVALIHRRLAAHHLSIGRDAGNVWGAGTTAAVTAWQRATGRKLTGLIGRADFAALMAN
jgi:hypothetical protein